MSSFELLIREHDELALQVERVEGLLKPGRPAVSQTIAARTTLSGLLDSHLAHEDAEIYPRLMTCRDEPTAHLARNFHADFGRLVEAWGAYLAKWDETAATKNWRGFCAETRVVLSVLGARIQKENQLLYPAALGAAVIGLRER